MPKIPEVISANFKYVTTRKSHYCEGCSYIIDKGTKCLHVSGRIGTFFSNYFCNGCDLDRINSIPTKGLRRKLLVLRNKIKLEEI